MVDIKIQVVQNKKPQRVCIWGFTPKCVITQYWGSKSSGLALTVESFHNVLEELLVECLRCPVDLALNAALHGFHDLLLRKTHLSEIRNVGLYEAAVESDRSIVILGDLEGTIGNDAGLSVAADDGATTVVRCSLCHNVISSLSISQTVVWLIFGCFCYIKLINYIILYIKSQNNI